MSKQKYTFIRQPKAGEFGEWKTADGYTCYTDTRERAVRWYARWLKKKSQ